MKKYIRNGKIGVIFTREEINNFFTKARNSLKPKNGGFCRIDPCSGLVVKKIIGFIGVNIYSQPYCDVCGVLHVVDQKNMDSLPIDNLGELKENF